MRRRFQGTDVDQMILETWDVGAIAARYNAFLERWRDPGGENERDPLAVKLLLACDWLQVIRADPRLPAVHLPANWPAAAAGPATSTGSWSRGPRASPSSSWTSDLCCPDAAGRVVPPAPACRTATSSPSTRTSAWPTHAPQRPRPSA